MQLRPTELTYTIDDHGRLQPMPAAEAPIHAKSWAEALPPWRIPTMTDAKIDGLQEWMVGGVWVQFRSGDMQDGITFQCFVFLSSLCLSFGSRPSTNCVGMGFYHLQSQSNGGGFSPCAGSTKRSPLCCTDQLWDLSVHTVTYVGWLFHSLFPFPSFLLYWLWQPRRSAPKERDNVTAWLHVTCPGPGNGHSI